MILQYSCGALLTDLSLCVGELGGEVAAGHGVAAGRRL